MSLSEAEKYEDARVIELIEKIGLKNVRGGRFFSGATKSKAIRRRYRQLDDKYKHKSSVIPKRVRRDDNKTGKRSPWARLEARSRYELSKSAKDLY